MDGVEKSDTVFEEWFTEHYGSVNINNGEGRSHLRDAFMEGWEVAIDFFAEKLKELE